MAPKPAPPVILPTLVVGPVDVGRLVREVAVISENLLELGLRSGDKAREVKLPKTSLLMDQIVELNKLNLLHETDRQHLQQALEAIKQQAPLLNISFSADPSPAFLDKLMTWLRSEIHPALLVTIGLQPNIGAGCVVRGPNRYFDFSLRQHFADQRELLIASLSPAVQPTEVKA